MDLWILILLIILGSLLLLVLLAKTIFLIKLNRKIKRHLVLLDVIICNQNDLFHSSAIILQRYQVETEQLDKLVFAKNMYQDASFNQKKFYLNNFLQAKSFIDAVTNVEILNDEKFISIKTNLDETFSDYGYFVNNYNKEVNLFNKHINTLLGKLISLIFVFKKRGNL